jgi:hypothetical protein
METFFFKRHQRLDIFVLSQNEKIRTLILNVSTILPTYSYI